MLRAVSILVLVSFLCRAEAPVKFWGTNVMPVELRSPGADVPESGASQPRRAPARAGVPQNFDATLRVQVALDRLGFSPGCLDGRWGSQSAEALRAWQRQQGLAASGVFDASVVESFENVTGYLTPFVITTNDTEGLTLIPKNWLERSRLPAMAHETVRERIAEKFHAKESLLEQLNPGVAWPDPEAGTVVIVPNVNAGAARLPRAARLEVNLDRKFIEAFDASGRVLCHFPCSIAAKVEKRPRGELKVVTAAPNPNYTFDPALFSEDPVAAAIPTKLIIPPGPNNPVGVAWIGLNLTGYGMHGTPRPEEIGKTESHGCFRLHNWNAARLIRVVGEAMPVTVVRSDE